MKLMKAEVRPPPAAISGADGAAAASPAQPSWRVQASAVSPCGGATLGILGGGEPSRRL